MHRFSSEPMRRAPVRSCYVVFATPRAGLRHPAWRCRPPASGRRLRCCLASVRAIELLADIGAREWLAGAGQAWKDIQERHARTVLVGYSMGPGAPARRPARLSGPGRAVVAPARPRLAARRAPAGRSAPHPRLEICSPTVRDRHPVVAAGRRLGQRRPRSASADADPAGQNGPRRSSTGQARPRAMLRWTRPASRA